MDTLLKSDKVTTTSQLAGIVPGNPPKVNLVDHATGRTGIKRHFAQQVPVPDKDLFARLQREVSVGDHIRVTIVNEYHGTKIVTYLADFHTTDNAPFNIIVQNGNGYFAQSNITEINSLQPEQNTKPKVRK